MVCAVNDPNRFIPFVQDGYPCGRHYKGQFYQARRCPHCAYVNFPTPPPGLLDAYYADEYPAISAAWYNVTADYDPYKTTPRSQRVIDLVQRFGIGPGASLHEFGCAFGGTVDALNQRGYDASGTELNAGAVAEGRARGNLAIHDYSALDYLAEHKGKVNAVYSYHAIEHFTDPFSFIAEMATLIDPNGVIILTIPNSAALFPMVYGHSHYVWFGYPEHLHLFSPGSTLSFAERVGCTLLHLEGREYGIQPGPTSIALNQNCDGAITLRGAERALMGEELSFVLTPSGSDLVKKYAEQVAYTRQRVHAFGDLERRAMNAGQRHVANPWPK